MTTMNTNPVETPKQQVLTEAKKEIQKLAEQHKNPRLAESFSALLARKQSQVF